MPIPKAKRSSTRHLDSVYANDVVGYHATTAEDLTLYEWCFTSVAPRRLRADGPAEPRRGAFYQRIEAAQSLVRVILPGDILAEEVMVCEPVSCCMELTGLWATRLLA